jgi:hypothetical protein
MESRRREEGAIESDERLGIRVDELPIPKVLLNQVRAVHRLKI